MQYAHFGVQGIRTNKGFISKELGAEFNVSNSLTPDRNMAWFTEGAMVGVLAHVHCIWVMVIIVIEYI